MNVQITDGLMVSARPQGGHHQPIRAFRTASGIYAFRDLPGLHDIEYPIENQAAGSPPLAFRFLIEVVDTRKRFLPAIFEVDIPHQGIFPDVELGSPPGNKLPGFYLFSAPTRPVPASLAVVRAQLVEHVDADTQRPAAHAVLAVQVPGPTTWYGVADDRGAVAVLFPYPTFTVSSPVASPIGSPATVVQQHWEVSVSVRYDSPPLMSPIDSMLPDLGRIFNQNPGNIWSTLVDQPSQPVTQVTTELIFGQALELRTSDQSFLMISPAP